MIFVFRFELYSARARSSPSPEQQNARHNTGSGGVFKLASNASVDAQPRLFILEYEPPYGSYQPGYDERREHGRFEPATSGTAPITYGAVQRLQLGCECLLCRVFTC